MKTSINLPQFEGARPVDLRVSFVRPMEFGSFDPLHVTRFLQLENVFQLGARENEVVSWLGGITTLGEGKLKSAYEPIVVHQAEAYLGFCSMKQLGVFLLPLRLLAVCFSLEISAEIIRRHYLAALLRSR